MPDITEKMVSLTVRHMWFVAIALVSVASTATYGWYSLKAEASEATGAVRSLDRRLTKMECLVEQQTRYQIYKELPRYRCE